MEQILINKIKELQGQGIQSAREIFKILSQKEILTQEIQNPRDAKKLESKLLAILIPEFTTLEEIKAIPKKDRKEFVADKLNAAYAAAATVALKLNILNKSQQILIYQLSSEQNGSQGFDDADFNRANKSETVQIQGLDYFEKNSLQIPTLNQIREAMKAK